MINKDEQEMLEHCCVWREGVIGIIVNIVYVT